MFKKIRKMKAQSTAEYAIMLGLVIAAIVAMQIYVQRTIKGKVFDAGKYLAEAGSGELGAPTYQYEPKYLSSTFTTSRSSRQTAEFDNKVMGGIRTGSATNTERAGSQTYTYTGPITTTGDL